MSNPLILSVNPGNLDTSVPNNSVIDVTFNQAMDPGTLTSLTMILSIDGNFIETVPRTISWNNATNRATIIPNVFLSNETTYRMLVVGATDPDANVITGVKNLGGEPMLGNISWIFSTATNIFAVPSGDPNIFAPLPPSSAIDVGPFLVTSVDPPDFDYNVPLDKVITVRFNDDLWIENSLIIENLPSGAYADPTGWMQDSLSITAKPVLGEQLAGFLPIPPQFAFQYDDVNDAIVINVTGSGYASSFYENGKYVQGTLTSGVWEQSTDYELTIEGNRIKGLATTIMVNDYVTLFTTLMIPMYTSVEDIRLSLGSFIANVPDNTIAVLIHRNSIRAQELGPFQHDDPPLYVRRFVSCKTMVDLITALFLGSTAGFGGGRRTLGDMTIAQDGVGSSDFLGPFLDSLNQCVAENAELIVTQGVGRDPGFAVPHSLASDPYPGEAWARLNSPDSVSDRLLKPGTVNRNIDNPPFPFRRQRISNPPSRRNI